MVVVVSCWLLGRPRDLGITVYFVTNCSKIKSNIGQPTRNNGYRVICVNFFICDLSSSDPCFILSFYIPLPYLINTEYDMFSYVDPYVCGPNLCTSWPCPLREKHSCRTKLDDHDGANETFSYVSLDICTYVAKRSYHIILNLKKLDICTYRV